MSAPFPTGTVRLSDAEWEAMKREYAGDAEYRLPIWRTMPNDEYRAMQRKLRPFREAQEVIDAYARKVRALRWYVEELEDFARRHLLVCDVLHGPGYPSLQVPAELVLLRCWALELPPPPPASGYPLRVVEPAARARRNSEPPRRREAA